MFFFFFFSVAGCLEFRKFGGLGEGVGFFFRRGGVCRSQMGGKGRISIAFRVGCGGAGV